VDSHDAIVYPLSGEKTPNLGPFAVLAAAQPDMAALCHLLSLPEEGRSRLFLSSRYADPRQPGGGTLVGPVIGAPYAAMLLENLAAWGVRKVVFLGWCGAVSPEVHIGDLVLPTAARIDEGTSAHYLSGDAVESLPSDSLAAAIGRVLDNGRVSFHAGKVWSTDAIYRETREKVRHFQAQQVLAVDMETSALFSVGRFRKLEIAALLVVSDEVSALRWLPGFKHERFKLGRDAACKVVHDLWQVLARQR
jgi:nucleoside phosphorylase